MKIFSAKITALVTFLIGTFFLHAQKKVIWKELDARALHIDSLPYKKISGKDLSLFYFLPEHINVKKKYPAIVFIHGGAWTGGAASTFNSYAAYFSKRNITAISIDYRLIKNKSDDIINCIADCKSAIRFIKANAVFFHIDPDKLVICGESAGGHLAACMQLLDSYNDPADDLRINTKPKALILLNPVLNLAVSTFIKYVDPEVLFASGGSFDSSFIFKKNLTKAKKISPLFQLQNDFPPTLLINGIDDKVTPALFAQTFADSINHYTHNNCRLVLWPDTGHAFAVPHYKSSELVVVNTVKEIEHFLTDLNILKGKSIISVGNDSNWIIKR